jgi:hypothetical protein
MLLPWEVERLRSLIEDENHGDKLCGDGYELDRGSCTIKATSTSHGYDFGEPLTLDVKDIGKGETAFQAYVLEQLSVGENTFLPEVFGRDIVWIGNEVFAGSGMQKIDVLTMERMDETNYQYRIIELKHPKSTAGTKTAAEQLRYYVEWARQDCGGHIVGGTKFNIRPELVVLTREFGSVSRSVSNSVSGLVSVATHPELWEINFSLKANKVV